MLYAIVDIETTGSYAQANGITEIAIAIHNGKTVLHFYETLINPQQPIPYFIQRLTNINDAMVAKAPTFQEVAGHIHELLQDKVFVAHNVNFDYSFVKYQLQTAGYELNTKKLCTVRLARKIIPGMNSYSLGKLCHQLGIGLQNQHRAGGDTLATSELFTLLKQRDDKQVIETMLKGRNKEQYLPMHLPVADIHNLPSNPGVYYFYNAAGKIIYVGKAKNILKRVRSHFSNNKPGKQKQDFLKEIFHVSCKECATELMAHILESNEIRRLWPIYNRSQRGYLPEFGLHVYEDRGGYKRIVIEKNKKTLQPVYTFNTILEGHNRIRELIHEFGLCPRLCNLASAACNDENGCDGNCSSDHQSYNQKVDEAIDWFLQRLPSFAFLDKGLDENEQSCILISRGNFYGMGYISDPAPLKNLESLQQHLEPLQDNDFIRNLVYKYAAKYPERCHAFS